ncbi:MAG: Nif3-like dinuclear metal center hexameric protein [Candidatus Sericytochromatia bacterium]|nr:Nif3-like dinuclear metal center hexameric protein [Candidatus Sericytochromatia bacterium]
MDKARILAALDRLAPPSLAQDWDNVGLQIGQREGAVNRVMVAITPGPDVIQQAISNGCQLLIAHHPLIFRPLKQIDTATPLGDSLTAALRFGLTVFTLHTNYDVIEPGVSSLLGTAIGLRDMRVLRETWRQQYSKLVTFVPASHTDAVLAAMTHEGAGQIGDYTECSFRSAGTGTFQPSATATPYSGDVGVLNREPEDRLEIQVPQERIADVVKALKTAHPYEAVAYDLYPLNNKGKILGLGRIGELAAPMPLQALRQHVQQALGATHVRMSGDPDQGVWRIAVCGGSCADLIPDAEKAGADVLITADIKYHQADDARSAGLCLLDPGHLSSEAPSRAYLATWLRQEFTDLEVVEAHETEPIA